MVMVIKAHSKAGEIRKVRFQDKYSKLFSVCCEQVSARQVIWMQEMWATNVLPPSGTTGSWWSLVRSDRFQNCGEIDPAVKCWWYADGVPTSRSTTYRRIKEMGYANRIPRVKPLLNFKQYKKWLTWSTEKPYWTVGQWSRVSFFDESTSCVSFGNRGPQVWWRKPYKVDKPDCTKSSIKFPQSTIMVWGHRGEEYQQLQLDLCVFCEQMSLLLFIKKSWSIFCFRWLSNCLEVTSSHSNATWLLPIMPNPSRLKP